MNNMTPDLQPYLVDWLKSMVASQRTAYVVDPKLPEKPTSKELKRVLLVALRCADPDLEDRPRMGEVLHMLEAHDLLLCDVRSTTFPLSICPKFTFYLLFSLLLLLIFISLSIM